MIEWLGKPENQGKGPKEYAEEFNLVLNL